MFVAGSIILFLLYRDLMSVFVSFCYLGVSRGDYAFFIGRFVVVYGYFCMHMCIYKVLCVCVYLSTAVRVCMNVC